MKNEPKPAPPVAEPPSEMSAKEVIYSCPANSIPQLASSRLPATPATPVATRTFDDNYSEAAAFAGITFSQACQFDMYMKHLLGKGTAPSNRGHLDDPTPPAGGGAEQSKRPLWNEYQSAQEYCIDIDSYMDSIEAQRDAALGKVEELEKHEHAARNLLAVMHCDGGHYVSHHGFVKACEDAELVRHTIVQIQDDLRDRAELAEAELKALKGK